MDSTSVKSESCLESRKEYHIQFQGTGILSTTRKAAANVEVMKPKKLLSWHCYSAAVST